MYRKSIALGSVLCLAVLAATAVAAGDWSDAQKDVWADVQAYWELWSKGDISGFAGYMHDDYNGWSVDTPMPASKASSTKWMSFWAGSNSVLLYEITPVAIAIHGDVAVAHYYYSHVSKDGDGKVHTEQGRWTDVLVKQGDRWLLFADHGGSPDDDD